MSEHGGKPGGENGGERDELWRLEEHFWRGNEAFFEGRLARSCIMVFPGPAGIMTRAAAIEGLRRAPRWTSVEMTERQVAMADKDTVTLAYRARAKRATGGGNRKAASYAALCSSSYRRLKGQWRMFEHQQTPL